MGLVHMYLVVCEREIAKNRHNMTQYSRTHNVNIYIYSMKNPATIYFPKAHKYFHLGVFTQDLLYFIKHINTY